MLNSKLTDSQKCALLLSLKEQYYSSRPMYIEEENLMYDLSEYFWKKNKGNHTLLSNIRKTSK